MNEFFKQRMAILLSKFRIDYSDLVIISDANRPPKAKTKEWFNGIIRPFKLPKPNGKFNPNVSNRNVNFQNC